MIEQIMQFRFIQIKNQTMIEQYNPNNLLDFTRENKQKID
jgi:hypothetical protein